MAKGRVEMSFEIDIYLSIRFLTNLQLMNILFFLFRFTVQFFGTVQRNITIRLVKTPFDFNVTGEAMKIGK